jgi:spermidine synthase
VERLCTDGRHALAISDEKYDLIVVNVLDPYTPGSSALFTTDFWELAKSHLNPGGVYAQLLWGPDAERLVQGLASVFPKVIRFPGGWEDAFNVVALMDDGDPQFHVDRLSSEARRALRRFSIGDPERYFRDAVRRSLVFDSRAAGQPPLAFHTDDMPILEYLWIRGDPYTPRDVDYENTSIFDSLQVQP